MSPAALYQRLQLLLSQDRFQESRDLLETYLSDYPDDVHAQINYVNVLVLLGDKELAREVIEPILGENPDDATVLTLAATIELMDGKDKVAEEYARTLLDMDARDEGAFVLMARIKMQQNNYDAALHYAEEALAIDPEEQEALNMKIFIGSLLGHKDVSLTVEDALNVAPDDPSTIAQHAYSLLSEGKVKESLERSKYALSLNPRNQMARYVMLEGLKARNPLYGAYFKYIQAMSRLSGGASYAVTIGLWIGVNALNRYAESNPSSAVYIKPIVYLAIAAFLLTWVITPLMDFYLLTNKYGKVLLDKKEKLMARLVGGALGTAIIGFVGSMLTGLDRFFLLGIASIGLMIPFGSFLRPLREKQRQTLIIYTAVLLFIGIAGIISLNSLVLTGGVLALLGYQFLINGMTAKESGRTFGA